ncbi:hypothetical protein V8E36_004964 [Tilletia maclaganii]
MCEITYIHKVVCSLSLVSHLHIYEQVTRLSPIPRRHRRGSLSPYSQHQTMPSSTTGTESSRPFSKMFFVLRKGTAEKPRPHTTAGSQLPWPSSSFSAISPPLPPPSLPSSQHTPTRPARPLLRTPPTHHGRARLTTAICNDVHPPNPEPLLRCACSCAPTTAASRPPPPHPPSPSRPPPPPPPQSATTINNPPSSARLGPNKPLPPLGVGPNTFFVPPPFEPPALHHHHAGGQFSELAPVRERSFATVSSASARERERKRSSSGQSGSLGAPRSRTVSVSGAGVDVEGNSSALEVEGGPAQQQEQDDVPPSTEQQQAQQQPDTPSRSKILGPRRSKSLLSRAVSRLRPVTPSGGPSTSATPMPAPVPVPAPAPISDCGHHEVEDLLRWNDDDDGRRTEARAIRRWAGAVWVLLLPGPRRGPPGHCHRCW